MGGGTKLDGVARRRVRRGAALGWLGAAAVLVVLILFATAAAYYWWSYVREPGPLRGAMQRPAPALVASDDPARGSIAFVDDGEIVAGPTIQVAVVPPADATEMQVGFDPSFETLPWVPVSPTVTVVAEHVGYQILFGRFRSGPDAAPSPVSVDGITVDPTYGAATSSASGDQQLTWVRTVSPRHLAVRIEAGRIARGAQERYDFDNPPEGDDVNGLIGRVTVDRNGEPYGVKVDGSEDLLRPYDTLIGRHVDGERIDSGLWLVETLDGTRLGVEGVERISRPAGAGTGPDGEQIVPLIHDVILTMAEPLEESATYVVQPPVDVAASAEVTIDTRTGRSPAVHVNQNGYDPDDMLKVGYLSRPFFETGDEEPYRNAMAFSIVDEEDDSVVFEGEVGRRPGKDELNVGDLTGAPVFEADFSELTQIGRFRLCVDAVGCSEPFRIGENVWSDLTKSVARAMYHQRSGIALGPPYTPVARPRPYHPNDGMVVRTSEFTLLEGLAIPGGDVFGDLVEQRTDQVDENAWGGHFDAGDWDRRIQHLFYVRSAVELVELEPDRYEALDLQIPESGDAVPDLLDEALWSLDLYRRIQREDGAVSGGVEASEHPQPDSTSWSDDLAVFTYAPDPYSSFVYAGVAAQAAAVLEAYDPDRAALFADSAIEAAQWAQSQPVNENNATLITEARSVAAAALYKLTEDEVWHDDFLAASTLDDEINGFLTCNGHGACDAGWIYLSIDEDRTDPDVRNNIRQSFVVTADDIVAASETTSYGWSIENRFIPLVWGSGPGGSPGAIGLMRAHRLTGDERYRDAALRSAAVSLGANPTNTVFMTGTGRNPVRYPVIVDFLHGGLPVWPGTPIYGPHRLNQLSDDSWIDTYVLEPAGVQPLGADLPYLWQWFDVPYVALFNEFTVHQSHGEALYVYGLLDAS